MKNYRYEIDQIRETHLSNNVELVAQVVLLSVGVMAGWIVLGLWQLPVWFLVAYGLVALEKYLHTRDRQNYSRKLYINYLVLSVAIAAAASYLPVFVWFQGGEPYHFAAMAYQVGAILNTFLMRSKSWQLMMCYLIPNAIVVCTIAVSYFVRSGFSNSGYIMLLMAVLISVYFAVSVVHAVQRHRRDDETAERLIHAQKMETVGNLAGGIAHDFNNILGVVSGSLELLQYAKTDEEREHLISQALSATERSAGLTRQLLAFGRQSHLSPEHVDIEAMFGELQVMMERLVPTYINVAFGTAEDLDTVWIDKSTLQSTIINFVMNARDAMQSAGEITVYAQTIQVPAEGLEVSTGRLTEGEYIEFSVQDNGEGISPDVFGRVLEPFYTTKDVGMGSGLGLSMAAGFARQSGGGVIMSTELKKGTRVALLIRREHQPEDAEAVQLPSNEEHTAAPRLRKILIVEDEPKLRAVLERHLNNQGFAVKVAKNGDAALEVVSAGFEPELVLTDVVMPGNVQGIELVKALHPTFPDSKYIVMTGYSYSKESELTASNLEYSMISKPFRLQELTEHLKRVQH